MDVFEGEFIRQMLSVLIVLALLGAAVWRLRTTRGIGLKESSRLKSAGRLALTAQHAVHLVRVDGREMVVATHPQGCSLLCESVFRENGVESRV
jgi:flagellar biogenesis protein FliO